VSQTLIAASIFFATYLILAVGQPPLLRIDRTGAAIVGAILMMVAGIVPIEEAYRAIDYRTIVLLFGMMVLIAHLRLARFFRTIVRVTAHHIHHPALLIVAVVFTSGILSALFVNDTVCLVFTPVLIEIAVARGHRPLPYLLALATAANIGGAATITGNPQNMLIGSLSGIAYREFAWRLGPVAFVGLALDAAIICVLFRHELEAGRLEHEGRGPRPIHRALMAKSLGVAAAVLGAMLAGIDPPLAAAAGAAALLITRRVKPEKVYGQIDWDLLMLFIGLFVVVHGIEVVGLDQRFFDLLRPVGIHTVWGLSAASALLSNVISNVPAVMLFTRVIPQLPDPDTSWLALAMSSTLAGNLTLLGSIANLIVLEGARRRGVQITFMEYLRVGLPVTAATMAFGIFWLSW
jgi:Na+/H+ antiporter NhaD/arsenite permease-like protein